MLNVTWIKNSNGLWCNLLNLDLNHEHFNNLVGVYIIWHGGDGHNVVRVGQGMIKDRLSNHREDQEILDYSDLGLNTTWALVATEYLNGVERFLAERFNPKVGVRFPMVYSIEVNLPA